MWLCCNRKSKNLVKSLELAKATDGSYLHILMKEAGSKLIHFFKFQAFNMKIGYATRQHAVFASRQKFECNY
jgi:hypothetical protein